MRKIIHAAFVSLDGIMQAPGGPEEDENGGFAHGGWTVPYWDEMVDKAMEEALDRSFDLLLGRRTYDIFAAHWPRVTDPAQKPLADLFNRITKYVATHSPETLAWQNSQPLGPDVAASLRALRQTDGPDLLIQGSSVLTQTLLAQDLIDEIRLMIFPLVLGAGKRLFGPGTLPAALKLTASQTSATGVLIASYERAGAITTGSFALG